MPTMPQYRAAIHHVLLSSELSKAAVLPDTSNTTLGDSTMPDDALDKAIERVGSLIVRAACEMGDHEIYSALIADDAPRSYGEQLPAYLGPPGRALLTYDVTAMSPVYQPAYPVRDWEMIEFYKRSAIARTVGGPYWAITADRKVYFTSPTANARIKVAMVGSFDPVTQIAVIPEHLADAVVMGAAARLFIQAGHRSEAARVCLAEMQQALEMGGIGSRGVQQAVQGAGEAG